MTFKKAILSTTTAALLAASSFIPSALADENGVQLGQLTCEVEGGVGFIFGSSKDLICTFNPANDSFPEEIYTGTINKYGIDIGVTGESVILWTVVAAEDDVYAPPVSVSGSTGVNVAVGLAQIELY